MDQSTGNSKSPSKGSIPFAPAIFILLLCIGCAGSSYKQEGDDINVKAWVIGQSSIQAGDCAIAVQHDLTEKSEPTVTKDIITNYSPSCIMINGGKGSEGFWATVGAGVGTLVGFLIKYVK